MESEDVAPGTSLTLLKTSIFDLTQAFLAK